MTIDKRGDTMADCTGNTAYRLKSDFLRFGLCAILVAAAVYGWSLQFTYGYLEELGIHLVPWTHPQSVKGLNVGFFYLMGVSGRPLSGLVYWLVQEAAPLFSIDTLWIYRLTGLVLAACAAALIAKELAVLLRTKLLGFLFCALIMLLPAVAVQAVQGHIFLQPIAGILSLYAIKMLVRFIEEHRGVYLAVALVLIVAADFIYQPWAMAGILVAVIGLLNETIDFRRRLIVFVSTVAVLIFGVGCSAVFAFANLWIRGVEFERLQAAGSPINRLAWFFSEPAAWAGSGFLFSKSIVFASLFVASAAVLAWTQRRKEGAGRASVVMLLLLAAIPLSWAPNLASADSNVVIRTLPVLSVLALCFYVLCCDRLLTAWEARAWGVADSRAGAMLAAAVVLLSGGFTAMRLTERMVLPLAVETAAVREALAAYDPGQKQNIVMVRPVMFPWTYINDFGGVNGIMEFALLDLARAVLDSSHPSLDIKNIKIEMRIVDTPIDLAASDFLVDLRPAYRLAGRLLDR